MNEKNLLKFGYLPKELPPPFNTVDLADNISRIRTQWSRVYNNLSNSSKKQYRETSSCKYTIPKTEYVRRILSIPNPLAQIQLSELLNTNWEELETIFLDSDISFSKPIEDTRSNRYFTTYRSFGEFTVSRLIISCDSLYEIKTDISRFYNSIYTHSIPWAIHGKEVAKQNRNDNSLIGNQLDKVIREGNHGQTIGIPIGPDTSLVIAELIHCKIDDQLKTKYPKLKFIRFIDDLYIYGDTLSSAENFIKDYQNILSEFQLELNEEKTIIEYKVFKFESSWTSDLSNFNFRSTSIGQRTDLERFAAIIFELSKRNPHESILFYAVQILSKLNLRSENWDIYQAILFKILLVEPKSIDTLAKIFIKNEDSVNKESLKRLLEKIIDLNISKNHHFEVSWSLWLMKEFSFKLSKKQADKIVVSNDVISILIVLDLKSKNLTSSSFNPDILGFEIEGGLFSDKWLLFYEGILKGWLPTNSLLEDNKFFKILKDLNISFYDDNYSLRLNQEGSETDSPPFYQIGITNEDEDYDLLDYGLNY